MPLVHQKITLTDTAQLIAEIDNMAQEVHLHNMAKAALNYIYVGGPDVDASNSIHIDPGESKVLRIFPGDALYAMSSPAGVDLGVLQIQQRD